ncbi:MAG: hypothetical protein QM689_02735 [Oscillospiraceae bacterium]
MFIVAIIVIAAVVGLACAFIYSFAPPDKSKTEKYFNHDVAEINLVKDYMSYSGYLEIYIDKATIKNDTMFTGVITNDVRIEDSEVVKAIKRLINQRGVNCISKDGNTIYFEKWRLSDQSRGIAYSINKTDKPELQYLTKLEPLSEDGWYYYETDYNEWRTQ